MIIIYFDLFYSNSVLIYFYLFILGLQLSNFKISFSYNDILFYLRFISIKKHVFQ